MKKRFLIFFLVLLIGCLLLLTGCDMSDFETKTNITNIVNEISLNERTSFDDLSYTEKENANKFIKKGFSIHNAISIMNIFKQCKLGEISGELEEGLSLYNNSVNEQYDESYSCKIKDEYISEYRIINLYFFNKELVYVCNSNHLIIYYTKTDGIVDDYSRTIIN